MSTLSIPSIITWRKSKKQTSRLNSYHQEMTSLYDDGKLDENDTDRLSPGIDLQSKLKR
jgi:hypothetical protein